MKYLKTIWQLIIAPLIVGVILIKIENGKLFSDIMKFLKTIVNFIFSIFTIKIPLWLIIIIIIVTIFIIYTIKKVKKSEQNLKKKTSLPHEDYTEDYYEGLKYEWTWYRGFEGLEIENIHPICECGCSFNYEFYDRKLTCPDCKKEYPNNVDIESAEKVFVNRYNKKLKKYKEEIKDN